MVLSGNAVIAIKIGIWSVGLYFASLYSLGKYYFIISAFLFIFTNLRTAKPGELSAYSIFNKNCKRLPGAMTGDEMMGLKRRQSHETDE